MGVAERTARQRGSRIGLSVEPHGLTAVASAFANASAFAEASADRSADKSCEGG